MNRYLLLRENQEMGPYTLEELYRMRPENSDFISIEGKSDGWKRIGEIDELKGLFHSGFQNDAVGFSENKDLEERNIYTSLPLFHSSEEVPQFNNAASVTSYQRPETDTSLSAPVNNQYLHTLSEKETKIGKSRFITRFFWMLVPLAILLAGVFITKIVRRSNEELVRPKQISSNMPKEVLDNTENFQNALTKEIVLVPDSAMLAAAKKARAKSLKKQVKTINNDYRVSLFGGINDLKITVQNNSVLLLDKVTVQIDYLKRNGDIINSDTLSAKMIKPQGSKVIEVPSSSRGVKVKHKIINIQSHEDRVSMLHV